jgi:hypothetical protein
VKKEEEEANKAA